MFAELITTKISESDAVSIFPQLFDNLIILGFLFQLLATAERELSQLSNGNQNNFKEKIKEVDEKLENLILDFTDGVNQLNSVLTDLAKIESLLGGIQTETESSESNINASNGKSADVKELVREIQNEMNRVLNLTAVEGPTSLQSALDRSDSLDSNSGELKSILDEAKTIILGYEINLINAKNLTKQVLAKFGELDRKIQETKSKQQELDDEMKIIGDLKATESELKNIKKLTQQSFDESNQVFEQSFEMLNEIARFELNDDRKEIDKNLERMKNFSTATVKSLESFISENSELLKEVEKTIAKAENVEERAFKIQKDVDETLQDMKKLKEDTKNAVGNKDDIMRDASRILTILNDFRLKIENDREIARRSLEKIEKITKKIGETLKALVKAEQSLKDKSKVAFKRRDENVSAKNIMDEVIEISGKIKLEIPQIQTTVDELSEDGSKNDKDSMIIGNQLDALEGREDSDFITLTKENVERTKQMREETDDTIDETIEKLKNTLDEVATMKTYDELDLGEFGKYFFNFFIFK